MSYYATVQELDVERWQRFADFALQYGLIEKKVNVADVIWMGGN
jgi:ABC-type nitrate/sulfonate/bicarbonate transport system substrate-binding protein